MEDPVMCTDGQTYERAAVAAWLATHTTSPLTGAPLPHKNLISNMLARRMIAGWRRQHGGG